MLPDQTPVSITGRPTVRLRLVRLRHPARGVRRVRRLDAARRGRRPDRVLRPVRAAAPRPGGGRHRGQRRQPRPPAQGHRARCQRVHTGDDGTAHRLPRASATPATAPPAPTPSATSSRSSSRRCTARWPSPTTATSSTRQRCATSCSTRGFGLTATSDTEVMTLMLAAAGGRTWEERVERTLPAWKGAFSLVILAADRVIARARPVGVPADERRPAPARRLRGRVGDLRAEHARLRRHQRGRARARSSRCSGAEITRRQALTPAARVGALHVRVRVLQPSRQRVGRPQHAPRPPAARRGAGHASRRPTPTS